MITIINRNTNERIIDGELSGGGSATGADDQIETPNRYDFYIQSTLQKTLSHYRNKLEIIFNIEEVYYMHKMCTEWIKAYEREEKRRMEKILKEPIEIVEADRPD